MWLAGCSPALPRASPGLKRRGKIGAIADKRKRNRKGTEEGNKNDRELFSLEAACVYDAINDNMASFIKEMLGNNLQHANNAPIKLSTLEKTGTRENMVI